MRAPISLALAGVSADTRSLLVVLRDPQNICDETWKALTHLSTDAVTRQQKIDNRIEYR